MVCGVGIGLFGGVLLLENGVLLVMVCFWWIFEIDLLGCFVWV